MRLIGDLGSTPPSRQRRTAYRGLLTSHGRVLCALASDPEPTLRAIATQVNLTVRQVQNVLDELYADGLVRRTRAERRYRYEVIPALRADVEPLLGHAWPLLIYFAPAVDLGRSLGRECEWARTSIGADSAAVYAVEPGHGPRRVASAEDAGSGELPDYLAPGEGPVGRALASGAPELADDSAPAPGVGPPTGGSADRVRAFRRRAAVAVPLGDGSAPLGALLLERRWRPPFRREDVYRLAPCIDRLATVLRRAQALRELLGEMAADGGLRSDVA